VVLWGGGGGGGVVMGGGGGGGGGGVVGGGLVGGGCVVGVCGLGGGGGVGFLGKGKGSVNQQRGGQPKPSRMQAQILVQKKEGGPTRWPTPKGIEREAAAPYGPSRAGAAASDEEMENVEAREMRVKGVLV